MFYLILGDTSGNFSKSDKQMIGIHAAQVIKIMGAVLPQVFQFYGPIAPYLNHVLMLFFHCFS